MCCPHQIRSDQVAQSRLTLCNPMNCSMPGLPAHHQLPEFTETYVHRVSDAIQPSHPLLSTELFGRKAMGCNNLHLYFSFYRFRIWCSLPFLLPLFSSQLQLENSIVQNFTPREPISNLGSHWFIKNPHFKRVGQSVPCNQRQLETFAQP